jgi:hypothetical protein
MEISSSSGRDFQRQTVKALSGTLNSALATAGAITGVAGSPTPVGGCAELTISTSTRGI